MTAPAGYSTATLHDFVGHDFGASAPVTVGQDRIEGFAEVTGDHQWIHVDVARARAESPFGGPVAHGFLTLSLLAAAVTEAGVVPADAKGVINYGLDKIRFLAPIDPAVAGDRKKLAAMARAAVLAGLPSIRAIEDADPLPAPAASVETADPVQAQP